MAIPTDRASFIQYCLRRLGKGAITPNVTPAQCDDRVDDALKKFYQRHYNAVEDVYYIIVPTEQDLARGYITTPPDVVSVIEVSRPATTSTPYNIEYQWRMSELYTMSSIYRYGDITYYYMSRMHLNLLDRTFSPIPSYNFNPVTRRLIVKGLAQVTQQAGGILVRAHRKVMGENLSGASDVEVFENVWDEQWLKDYATALIKRQWGQNLIKYNGVALVGGTTLNGEQISNEATAEIEMLEAQLMNEWELPIDFYLG